LLRQHPDLRPEEVYAALTYFYDHYEQLVSQLKTSDQTTEELPEKFTFSRAELLRRKSAGGA